MRLVVRMEVLLSRLVSSAAQMASLFTQLGMRRILRGERKLREIEREKEREREVKGCLLGKKSGYASKVLASINHYRDDSEPDLVMNHG